MIKFIVLFIILNIANAFGEEPTYLFLRDNTNYILDEEVQDYVVSSESVNVLKEDGKVTVRNIALSPVTDVYLNLILVNGDIKTYVLKKQLEKGSITALENHNLKNNFYVKNYLNLEMDQDGKQRKYYRNEIFHKYSNKSVQIKSTVQDDDLNPTQKTFQFESIKLGYYKNYLEYRYRNSLSSPLNYYRVDNYYALHLQGDLNTTELEVGKLYKGSNAQIQQATTIFDLKNNIVNLNVSQNSETKNTDYGFYGISSYGKNRMYLKYNINQDQIVNNYFHEYNASYFYDFNTEGNFKIKNIGFNHYENQYTYNKLDGLLKNKKSYSSVELNTSYKDFSFNNAYSKNDTIFTQEMFYNRISYSDRDLNLDYSFESNYSILNQRIATHSMNHLISKTWGYYTQGFGFGINENEKSLTNNMRFDNGKYYANLQYTYSYGINDYKSDRLFLNLAYRSDKWQLSNLVYYSNLFTSSFPVLNDTVEYSYNFTPSLAASSYLRFVKYAQISKSDYQVGLSVNYTFGTNIKYSSYSSKKDKKNLILCLDSNYDFNCDTDELMGNESIVVNSDGFTSLTTNSEGKVIFDKASKIDEINIDFNNTEYFLTKKEDRGDDWIMIVQKLKPYKLSAIDQRNGNLFNDIAATVVCPGYNYSKKIKLYTNSLYHVPYGPCSLEVSIVDNISLPLGKDFTMPIDSNLYAQNINISPLRRKTLYFYVDKNNNKDMDADESVSLTVNGKKTNGEYVIDNYDSKNPLKIDSRYSCDYQLGTGNTDYFDETIKVICKKK